MSGHAPVKHRSVHAANTSIASTTSTTSEEQRRDASLLQSLERLRNAGSVAAPSSMGRAATMERVMQGLPPPQECYHGTDVMVYHQYLTHLQPRDITPLPDWVIDGPSDAQSSCERDVSVATSLDERGSVSAVSTASAISRTKLDHGAEPPKKRRKERIDHGTFTPTPKKKVCENCGAEGHTRLGCRRRQKTKLGNKLQRMPGSEATGSVREMPLMPSSEGGESRGNTRLLSVQSVDMLCTPHAPPALPSTQLLIIPRIDGVAKRVKQTASMMSSSSSASASVLASPPPPAPSIVSGTPVSPAMRSASSQSSTQPPSRMQSDVSQRDVTLQSDVSRDARRDVSRDTQSDGESAGRRSQRDASQRDTSSHVDTVVQSDAASHASRGMQDTVSQRDVTLQSESQRDVMSQSVHGVSDVASYRGTVMSDVASEGNVVTPRSTVASHRGATVRSDVSQEYTRDVLRAESAASEGVSLRDTGLSDVASESDIVLRGRGLGYRDVVPQSESDVVSQRTASQRDATVHSETASESYVSERPLRGTMPQGVAYSASRESERDTTMQSDTESEATGQVYSSQSNVVQHDVASRASRSNVPSRDGVSSQGGAQSDVPQRPVSRRTTMQSDTMSQSEETSYSNAPSQREATAHRDTTQSDTASESGDMASQAYENAATQHSGTQNAAYAHMATQSNHTANGQNDAASQSNRQERDSTTQSEPRGVLSGSSRASAQRVAVVPPPALFVQQRTSTSPAQQSDTTRQTSTSTSSSSGQLSETVPAKRRNTTLHHAPLDTMRVQQTVRSPTDTEISTRKTASEAEVSFGSDLSSLSPLQDEAERKERELWVGEGIARRGVEREAATVLVDMRRQADEASELILFAANEERARRLALMKGKAVRQQAAAAVANHQRTQHIVEDTSPAQIRGHHRNSTSVPRDATPKTQHTSVKEVRVSQRIQQTVVRRVIPAGKTIQEVATAFVTAEYSSRAAVSDAWVQWFGAMKDVEKARRYEILLAASARREERLVSQTQRQQRELETTLQALRHVETEMRHTPKKPEHTPPDTSLTQNTPAASAASHSWEDDLTDLCVSEARERAALSAGSESDITSVHDSELVRRAERLLLANRGKLHQVGTPVLRHSMETDMTQPISPLSPGDALSPLSPFDILECCSEEDGTRTVVELEEVQGRQQLGEAMQASEAEASLRYEIRLMSEEAAVEELAAQQEVAQQEMVHSHAQQWMRIAEEENLDAIQLRRLESDDRRCIADEQRLQDIEASARQKSHLEDIELRAAHTDAVEDQGFLLQRAESLLMKSQNGSRNAIEAEASLLQQDILSVQRAERLETQLRDSEAEEKRFEEEVDASHRLVLMSIAVNEVVQTEAARRADIDVVHTRELEKLLLHHYDDLRRYHEGRASRASGHILSQLEEVERSISPVSDVDVPMRKVHLMDAVLKGLYEGEEVERASLQTEASLLWAEVLHYEYTARLEVQLQLAEQREKYLQGAHLSNEERLNESWSKYRQAELQTMHTDTQAMEQHLAKLQHSQKEHDAMQKLLRIERAKQALMESQATEREALAMEASLVEAEVVNISATQQLEDNLRTAEWRERELRIAQQQLAHAQAQAPQYQHVLPDFRSKALRSHDATPSRRSVVTTDPETTRVSSAHVGFTPVLASKTMPEDLRSQAAHVSERAAKFLERLGEKLCDYSRNVDNYSDSLGDSMPSRLQHDSPASPGLQLTPQRSDSTYTVLSPLEPGKPDVITRPRQQPPEAMSATSAFDAPSPLRQLQHTNQRQPHRGTSAHSAPSSPATENVTAAPPPLRVPELVQHVAPVVPSPAEVVASSAEPATRSDSDYNSTGEGESVSNEVVDVQLEKVDTDTEVSVVSTSCALDVMPLQSAQSHIRYLTDSISVSANVPRDSTPSTPVQTVQTPSKAAKGERVTPIRNNNVQDEIVSSTPYLLHHSTGREELVVSARQVYDVTTTQSTTFHTLTSAADTADVTVPHVVASNPSTPVSVPPMKPAVLSPGAHSFVSHVSAFSRVSEEKDTPTKDPKEREEQPQLQPQPVAELFFPDTSPDGKQMTDVESEPEWDVQPIQPTTKPVQSETQQTTLPEADESLLQIGSSVDAAPAPLVPPSPVAPPTVVSVVEPEAPPVARPSVPSVPSPPPAPSVPPGPAELVNCSKSPPLASSRVEAEVSPIASPRSRPPRHERGDSHNDSNYGSWLDVTDGIRSDLEDHSERDDTQEPPRPAAVHTTQEYSDQEGDTTNTDSADSATLETASDNEIPAPVDDVRPGPPSPSPSPSRQNVLDILSDFAVSSVSGFVERLQSRQENTSDAESEPDRLTTPEKDDSVPEKEPANEDQEVLPVVPSVPSVSPKETKAETDKDYYSDIVLARDAQPPHAVEPMHVSIGTGVDDDLFAPSSALKGIAESAFFPVATSQSPSARDASVGRASGTPATNRTEAWLQMLMPVSDAGGLTPTPRPHATVVPVLDSVEMSSGMEGKDEAEPIGVPSVPSKMRARKMDIWVQTDECDTEDPMSESRQTNTSHLLNLASPGQRSELSALWSPGRLACDTHLDNTAAGQPPQTAASPTDVKTLIGRSINTTHVPNEKPDKPPLFVTTAESVQSLDNKPAISEPQKPALLEKFLQLVSPQEVSASEKTTPRSSEHTTEHRTPPGSGSNEGESPKKTVSIQDAVQTVRTHSKPPIPSPNQSPRTVSSEIYGTPVHSLAPSESPACSPRSRPALSPRDLSDGHRRRDPLSASTATHVSLIEQVEYPPRLPHLDSLSLMRKRQTDAEKGSARGTPEPSQETSQLSALQMILQSENEPRQVFPSKAKEHVHFSPTLTPGASPMMRAIAPEPHPFRTMTSQFLTGRTSPLLGVPMNCSVGSMGSLGSVGAGLLEVSPAHTPHNVRGSSPMSAMMSARVASMREMFTQTLQRPHSTRRSQSPQKTPPRAGLFEQETFTAIPAASNVTFQGIEEITHAVDAAVKTTLAMAAPKSGCKKVSIEDLQGSSIVCKKSNDAVALFLAKACADKVAQHGGMTVLEELMENLVTQYPKGSDAHFRDSLIRLSCGARTISERANVKTCTMTEVLLLWLYTAHGVDIDALMGFDVPDPDDDDEWTTYVKQHKTNSHTSADRTRNGCIFGEVNWAMREGGMCDTLEQMSPAVTALLRKWCLYIVTLIRIIDVQKGVDLTKSMERVPRLYRGFGGQNEEAFASMTTKNGKLFWPAFSSCACDRAVSISYIDGSAKNAVAQEGNAILFNIEDWNGSGVPMWHISQYPDEREVLLSPMALFNIKRVESDPGIVAGCVWRR